jgi:hypothetical protein
MSNIITPEWVEAQVENIRKKRADDELAHMLEDALYRNVLHAIAEGRAKDPSACAAAALESDAIEFSRWCA